MSDLSGVFSLRGFLYQIKVYELMTLRHGWKDGDIMSYEGLDDIDLENSSLLSYQHNFYQVKSGKLTKRIYYGVISNWMLLSAQIKDSSFSLVFEEDKQPDFSLDSFFESYYSYISSDDMINNHPNSKHSKAFALFYDKSAFKKHYFDFIKNIRFETIKEEDIEDLLIAEAKKKSITNIIRAQAFIYFYIDSLHRQIEKSVSNKQPFLLNNNHYFALYNNAISSVKREKYSFSCNIYPDKTLEELVKVTDSQFYEQIIKVSDVESFLIDNIRNELEYEIFKSSYDDDYSIEKINFLERSVKSRFNITLGDKRISNNYDFYTNLINQSYSCDVLEICYESIIGCCNYLTSSSADPKFSIKWDLYNE